jgi:Arc/MetJ-type ribon-helix-helix transcriptional regulator
VAKSIKVHPKKRRGRPATGKDPLVSARLPQALIDQIEQWSASAEVTRSEAIRRLVELGLTVKTPARHMSKPARAARAVELAANAIDKIGDPAAHPEEHAQRRRRLTKGPEEFREVRVDRPKAKGSPK